MKPIISEYELALFRFDNESVWKTCVKLIREGKLQVVEDAISYELLRKDIDKNLSSDS